MKSIKGLSFYNSEGSLIDVEELYAQVQQLKQDSAAKIIIGETASTTSTTSSDIDELAGTETDISLTNADDFKAGDMGISIVTVTDRNNSHGFMVFSALADEPDQPAETLHVRFIAGIYNGKNGSEPTIITEAAYAEALAAGTIEDDKLYYIQGTSDNTLNVSQTAQATTYNNTTSGLTATNVQAALDEVKADIPANGDFTLAGLSEKSYNSLTDRPTIPTTLAELSERSYNSLTDKPTIPANGDFTLAGLSEKSYNSLTDKPTIPTIDVASIATALGLTTAQLNNLIAFAKSITSASTNGTTVNNEFAAQSFDTTA